MLYHTNISKILFEIIIILMLSKVSFQEIQEEELHKNLDLKSLTIFSPSPCNSDIEFLYIIHSAPNHIGLRNALRSSWASTTIKNDLFQKVRRVFLIGRSNETIEELNKKEHNKNEDILLYDRVDAYRNMTIKV